MPPQVYVTVQQPSGGMPEWAKILISAAVGALLGIVSNIAMEFVKPYIAKKVTAKAVSDQLIAEFTENMRTLDSARRVLENASDKSEVWQARAAAIANVMASSVNTDSFDFHLKEDRPLVYKIDEGRLLLSFYQSARSVAPATGQAPDYKSMSTLFALAIAMGSIFIQHHKLSYVPRVHPLEKAGLDDLSDSSVPPQAWPPMATEPRGGATLPVGTPSVRGVHPPPT